MARLGGDDHFKRTVKAHAVAWCVTIVAPILVTFLIGRINEQTPSDLFGELNKQNQEILLLLHLLHHPADQLGQKSTSAA